MPNDKMGIQGMVEAVVFTFPEGKAQELLYQKETMIRCGDKHGLNQFMKKWCKRRPQGFWRRLFRVRGPMMISKHHNIVTNEGDALIADLLQNVTERTKLDNANAVIGVGTGFIDETKTRDALVTQVGIDEAMDTGYPQTEGGWGAANDGVIVYKATFEAGDLNNNGIDEALLGNGTDTMAYAQITPAIDVSATDTLECTWKLTLLGS